MSEKRKNPRYWQSHTDTILGPGVHVDGDVRFSGVLRTQGDIVGDVAPVADTDGSIVISRPGSIAGSIKARHIVVCGHVQGNAQASESVEVQGGASIVGSVSYRKLVIHPGGIVEGALTPVAAPEGEEDGQPPEPESTSEAYQAPTTVDILDTNGQAPVDRRKVGMVVGVLVVAVAVVWISWSVLFSAPTEGMPAEAAPPGVTSADSAESADGKAAPAVAAKAKELASAAAVPPPAIKKPEPVVKKPEPAVKKPEPTANKPAPSHLIPPPADGKVVAVDGDNPAKSNDFVFVACKEPCVLIRKGRNESGAGIRIALPKNGRRRIGITSGDILRVAEGKEMKMFFQGRMVSHYTLLSGVWMNFVPKRAEPVKPVQSAKPVEPVKPVEPTKQAASAKPAENTQPTDQAKPAESQ